MASGKISEGQHEINFLGSGATGRSTMIVLVSILVWTLEALLIIFLRSVRPSQLLSIWVYSFPVFHLLPWLIALQVFGKLKRGLNTGNISDSGVHLAYGGVMSLLVVTYVVLGSAEALWILGNRMGELYR